MRASRCSCTNPRFSGEAHLQSQSIVTNALFACAFLCACASPQTAGPELSRAEVRQEQHRQSLFMLEQRERELTRVYDVGDRLFRANAELCPHRGKSIGLFVENLNDYGRSLRRAASTLWQLDEDPRVAWVAAGGPSHAAGVRVGDRLLAIDGDPIPEERRAGRRARHMLEDAAERGPVLLELQRGGQILELTVTPRESCAYALFVADDDIINAQADSRNIVLFRGMMRFVQSEEELALILGHELAHNALRHVQAGRWNTTMGAIGGLALDLLAVSAGVNTGGAFRDYGAYAGSMLYSQEFESEADYVGMYFARRAGFDIENVEDVWRRMAAEHPDAIRMASTHPTTAERFLRLGRTREEIMAKEAAGEPLVPNLREETLGREQ